MISLSGALIFNMINMRHLHSFFKLYICTFLCMRRELAILVSTYLLHTLDRYPEMATPLSPQSCGKEDNFCQWSPASCTVFKYSKSGRPSAWATTTSRLCPRRRADRDHDLQLRNTSLATYIAKLLMHCTDKNMTFS